MPDRNWYAKNKERAKAYMKAYRKRHLKSILVREHAYREVNREKLRLSDKKRRTENPEKWRKITQRKEDRRWFGGNRAFVLKRDKATCQLCGMTDKEHRKRFRRAITVDHKDGQGRYSTIQNNDPDNLWVLCLPCHGRKDYYRSHP